MNSLEPIIEQHYSASNAKGAFRVVVVGAQMRTVGEVIPIAVAVFERVHLHASNGFKQGLTDKGRDSLDDSILVLDINIDAAWDEAYATSETLGSLVGTASWWVEKSLRLL